MIFDAKYNLPRPAGATDWLDSTVIAGLMVLTEHTESSKIDMRYYCSTSYYRRFPDDRSLTMSRDQVVPLFAGLWKQGRCNLVDLKRVDGLDWMSPSIKGHEARCKGLRSSWLQDHWLKADIAWAAKVRPAAEINQLLSILLVADIKFLKMFCDMHKSWRENLEEYWSGWRQEPELCNHIIKFIESKTN